MNIGDYAAIIYFTMFIVMVIYAGQMTIEVRAIYFMSILLIATVWSAYECSSVD